MMTFEVSFVTPISKRRRLVAKIAVAIRKPFYVLGKSSVAHKKPTLGLS